MAWIPVKRSNRKGGGNRKKLSGIEGKNDENKGGPTGKNLSNLGVNLSQTRGKSSREERWGKQ